MSSQWPLIVSFPFSARATPGNSGGARLRRTTSRGATLPAQDAGLDRSRPRTTLATLLACSGLRRRSRPRPAARQRRRHRGRSRTRGASGYSVERMDAFIGILGGGSWPSRASGAVFRIFPAGGRGPGRKVVGRAERAANLGARAAARARATCTAGRARLPQRRRSASADVDADGSRVPGRLLEAVIRNHSTYGSVTFVSEIVDVMGTAPGMFATQ
jgi:hypothetical protein